jgi:citrate lyase beta subunit
MTEACSYRSLLFVPGNQPDRFDKAVASGADAIIIDLEDAVPPDRKQAARDAALDWLSGPGGNAKAGLRINSPRTLDGCLDLAALGSTTFDPAFIMIPKTQTAVDLEIAAEASGCLHLLAIVECGRGLQNAADIAAQSPCGILFGGVDFSAALGADLNDWDALLHARSIISTACGAAGIPAYDVPFLEVRNLEQLTSTSTKVRRLGYTGRACIHPAQIESVNSVFTPTSEEVERARGILNAFDTANESVVMYDGKMVDRPVVLAAKRLLERSRS